MAAMQDVVMRVKNTFIDVTLRPTERRRKTFPFRTEAQTVCQLVEDDHDDVDETERAGQLEAGVADVATPEFTDDFSEASTTVASSEASGPLNGSPQEPEHVQRFWWTGRVWELSRDPQGCRKLQDALVSTVDETVTGAMLAELRGKVLEAARGPHSNYVLQKCISSSTHSQLQFVLDEITVKGDFGVAMLARHKYGCRIMQRLLEHCSAEQVTTLANHFLAPAHVLDTCAHPFGNYAMQTVYTHGTDAHKDELVTFLVQKPELAADTCVCTVLGKILAVGTYPHRLAISQALDSIPGLLTTLNSCKQGRFTARFAYQTLNQW